jgi:MFS family permease
MMLWRKKYYDVLPALSVRRRELRRAMRTITMGWMFGVVWMAITSGVQIKSYARILGFNDFAFGVLAAIPFLATFGQVPATIIVEKTGLRKHLFIYAGTISRLLWLVIAVIPWILPVPSNSAVLMLLVVLGVSSFLASLGGPAWFSWMGDLIPRRIRGRYMANRQLVTGSVQVVAVIGLGVLLDSVTQAQAAETATGQHLLMVVLSVLLAVSALFGMTDILLFYRVREVLPPRHEKPRPPVVDIRVSRPSPFGWWSYPLYLLRYGVEVFRQVIIDPLHDSAFRIYVLYAGIMTFAATVSGWFVILFSMETLGFNKLGVNFQLMVLGPVGGILGSRIWGKLIDRWGRRPVLIVATSGLILSMGSWMLVTRDLPQPAWLSEAVASMDHSLTQLIGRETSLIGENTSATTYIICAFAGGLLGGFFWTGVGLTQGNIMLGFADGPGRSKYVAASSVLISIGGVLGGLAGGTITQSLQFLQQHPIGPLQWNNYHAAILASLASFAAGILVLIRMPDPGSGRTRDMLRYMTANVFNVVSPRLFYYLRVLGLPDQRREDDGDSSSTH